MFNCFSSLITDIITWRPQRTPILKLHHLSVAMTDSPTWQSYLSYSLCTQPSPCRFKFITCKWNFLPWANRKLFLFSPCSTPSPQKSIHSHPFLPCFCTVSIFVLIVVGSFTAKPLNYSHIYDCFVICWLL
jgi:hypothetical protein